MLVDIIIIVVLILAILIGYLRGFYKELYNFVALVISAISAYFLSVPIGQRMASIFSFGDLPDVVVNLLKERAIPIFVGISIYIFIYITIKIIIVILVKIEKLPKEKILRPLGAFIKFLVSIFILTFFALPISLTEIASDYEGYEILDLYSGSRLTNVLLTLNPYIGEINDELKATYDSAKVLIDGVDFQNLDDEEVEAVKELLKDSKIAEEVMVGISKEIFDKIAEEGGEINFEGAPIDELVEAIKESDVYPTLKELYDEEILTDDIITRIIEENDIKGLDPEDIINMFN